MGAHITIDPSRTDCLEVLKREGRGEGVDISIETAAHPSVFPAAMDVLRIGGRLVCSSTFYPSLSVPLYPDVVEKELTIIGAHQPKCPTTRTAYYAHSQLENRSMALELMAQGQIDAGSLITHTIPWRDALEFYRTMAADRDVVGAVIDWTS